MTDPGFRAKCSYSPHLVTMAEVRNDGKARRVLQTGSLRSTGLTQCYRRRLHQLLAYGDARGRLTDLNSWTNPGARGGALRVFGLSRRDSSNY